MSEKEKEKLPELRIRYTKSREYRTVPATGVRGAMTPQGLLHVVIYHEHVDQPDVVIRNQHTGQERVETQPKQVPVERTEEFGIMVTPDVAVAIAAWLEERGRELLSRQEGKRAEGTGHED